MKTGHPPFWNRTSELALLEKASGTSGKMILTGPRGIGKSTLAKAWAAQRQDKGKGTVLFIHPPSPDMAPAEGEKYLLRTVLRQAKKASLSLSLPNREGDVNWLETIESLGEDRALGGVVLDGAEVYSHLLGSSWFGETISVLEEIPATVVVTGVPALASSPAFSPHRWGHLPIGPLSEDVVEAVLAGFWARKEAILGEETRRLMLFLTAGSPLALSGWLEILDGLSLDELDRKAILEAFISLLTTGACGRWWNRWWQGLFPDPGHRREMCQLALRILHTASLKEGPTPPSVAALMEVAGILIPHPAGFHPVDDPVAARVLGLAGRFDLTDRHPTENILSFLKDEMTDWEETLRREPIRQLTGEVARTILSWAGKEIPPAMVGSFSPLPPLPEMVGLSSNPFQYPGSGPFFILEGLSLSGPLKGVWWIAVAATGGPVGTEEIKRLTDHLEFRRLRDGHPGPLHLWVVSPGGFTGGARTAAAEGGLWFSTVEDLNRIRTCCGLDPVSPPPSSPDHLPPRGETGQPFDLTIPPLGDAELIAAAAVDQIAQQLGFSKEDRDRIKVALVEAVINALEHSSGNIYLRLIPEQDRLKIIVRDFGPQAVITKKKGTSFPPGPRRRGLGTTIMENFMDEIRFEPVPDGNKMVMIKRLPEKKDA